MLACMRGGVREDVSRNSIVVNLVVTTSNSATNNITLASVTTTPATTQVLVTAIFWAAFGSYLNRAAAVAPTFKDKPIHSSPLLIMDCHP